MRKLMSIITAAALLVSASSVLAGCNTAAYKENEDGIIMAEEGNTHMLGRTYVSNFKKLDEEDRNGDGKKTVQYEDVMFFNWPASGFEISFNGTGLKAQILSESVGESGPVKVYVLIDGDEEPDPSKVLKLEYVEEWYTLCEGLEDGEHTVKVVRIDSNDIPNGDRGTAIRAYDVLGGNTMNEAPEPSQYKIEAFGDSITCGDELFDNGDGTTSSDGWQTYAAYTARQFDAELNVISISGNGLICSLFGGKLFEIPDRFHSTDEYNTGKTDDWDFTKYQADLVLINLGTNDTAGVPNNFSFEEFEDAYVDFVTDIKTQYPDCTVIAMLGMMDGRGKMWPSIENAAARINEKYGECMYTLWLEVEGISDSPVEGGAHPSAQAQAKAGEEICKLVEEKLGWQRAEKYRS